MAPLRALILGAQWDPGYKHSAQGTVLILQWPLNYLEVTYPASSHIWNMVEK